MRIFLTVLVLIFSFQSWTKADDIRDFEIEGMSVGDSALDYFSKSEIENLKNSYNDKGYIYPKNHFYVVTFKKHKKFLVYDDVQFTMKDKDDTFKIYALMGIINHRSNIKDCYQKLDTIEKDLNQLFKNSVKSGQYEYFHAGDKSGKSKIVATQYTLDSLDTVHASCADWSEEINILDALRVTIMTKEFDIWANNLY